MTVVSAAIVLVSVVGLGIQAVRGDRTVGAQRAPTTVHDAALDDAFYHCIGVQTRSLVAPGQPVVIAAADLQDFVTLLKGAGSWITFADPTSHLVRLSLRNGAGAPGTCLGTVVVARYPAPHGGWTVRVGTGASVAGNGPPPPPPL